MAAEISLRTTDNHDVWSRLIKCFDRTIEEYRFASRWNLNGREFSSFVQESRECGFKEIYCWGITLTRYVSRLIMFLSWSYILLLFVQGGSGRGWYFGERRIFVETVFFLRRIANHLPMLMLTVL